jgi:hypothetical protein
MRRQSIVYVEEKATLHKRYGTLVGILKVRGLSNKKRELESMEHSPP